MSEQAFENSLQIKVGQIYLKYSFSSKSCKKKKTF